MNPIKIYKGKTDWWFYIAIVLLLLVPLIPFLKGNYSILSIGILIILFLVDLFLISTIIINRVELYEDHLIYHYSFSEIMIRYADIKSLKRTHSPIASSANSLDRIYIDTRGDELYVALKDNDAFIADVSQRKKQWMETS